MAARLIKSKSGVTHTNLSLAFTRPHGLILRQDELEVYAVYAVYAISSLDTGSSLRYGTQTAGASSGLRGVCPCFLFFCGTPANTAAGRAVGVAASVRAKTSSLLCSGILLKAEMGEVELLDGLWILVLGFIFAFAMAMMHGANDVANSFGTSVASGIVTLRQAVVLAGIFNFLGAVTNGQAVTDTIRKGIVNRDAFESEPEAFMLVNLAAIIGTFLFLAVCTVVKMPVSCTQSVLGGLIGATLAFSPTDVVWVGSPECTSPRGFPTFKCGGFVGIVLQWFIAPLVSLVISVLVFKLSACLMLACSEAEVRRRAPSFISCVFGLTSFMIAWFACANGAGKGKVSPADTWLYASLTGLTIAYVMHVAFQLYPALLNRNLASLRVAPAVKPAGALEGLAAPLADDDASISDARRDVFADECGAAMSADVEGIHANALLMRSVRR